MTPPRLTLPGAMNDLFLYRLARLLATAGAPVIRRCEGESATLNSALGVLQARGDGLARAGQGGRKAGRRRGGFCRHLAG